MHFYKKNIYIDKYRLGIPQSIKRSNPEKVILNSIYLQINKTCNMNCYFCNENNNINRITGCKKWNVTDNMTIAKYKEILEDSFKIGCRKLHIMGGEPLLNKELYFSILDLAKEIGYKDIFVYTNVFLLDDEAIKKSSDVSYVIHAVAHNQNLLNDIHVGEEIDIKIFDKKVKNLKKNDAPVYFNVCLCKKNYKYQNEINDYLSSFDPRDITFGYIYEEPLVGEYREKIHANLEVSKNDWNCNTFFHNSEHHQCLYGKLSIFQNGDITACPMMKDEVIANINETSILDLLRRKLQNKYWNLSSNKVSLCKDCGYRLVCSDCRAIEKAATNDLYGKKYCMDLKE